MTQKERGQNIKKRRVRLGLTQHQLAEKAFMSTGSVANVETGLYKVNLSHLEEVLSELEELHKN